jgi:hypothetical protein
MLTLEDGHEVLATNQPTPHNPEEKKRPQEPSSLNQVFTARQVIQ